MMRYFAALAIPILLVENGANYKDVGIIAGGLIFFTLKVFWAPVLDVVYLHSFGKRKTYIVPTHYILAGIYIFYSTSIIS